MGSARHLAVQLLGRTIEEGSYSNLLLDKALAASELSAADKKLCAQLYYGVMERRLTLEHILRSYSKKPPEKLDAVIRNILYLGLYQLAYCEKIPDRAAVNESVLLAKQFKKTSASGFVNAVLRSFLRDGKEIKFPKEQWKAMEVQYSVPAALCCQIVQEHGQEFADAFLADSLKTPPCTVRLNPLRGSIADLADEGLAPEAFAKPDNACRITCPDVRSSKAFQKGMFHVQDLASQLCCAILDPQPDETVLDLCAAPGGKTFTIAERMQDRGRVLAFDLHEHRAELIRKGAQRLGLTCITAMTADAAVYDEKMPQADRILCDVPCSGYGVIRRKPEIRYKPLSECCELPKLQYAILENAARYLKKGGTLVYSTCTILKAENEKVVERFLKSHPDFELVPLPEYGLTEGFATFSVCYDNCDGFFAAHMRRKG